MSYKRKIWENAGLLKNGTWGLMTKDIEKAQVLKAVFTTLSLMLRFLHRNPRPPRELGKSGAMLADYLHKRIRLGNI